VHPLESSIGLGNIVICFPLIRAIQLLALVGNISKIPGTTKSLESHEKVKKNNYRYQAFRNISYSSKDFYRQ
jgi:hypothetical protein